MEGKGRYQRSFSFLVLFEGLRRIRFIGVFFGPILLAILLTAIHIYEEVTK